MFGPVPGVSLCFTPGCVLLGGGGWKRRGGAGGQWDSRRARRGRALCTGRPAVGPYRSQAWDGGLRRGKMPHLRKGGRRWRAIFQWLENGVEVFPMVGKNGVDFSNGWKKFGRFFQRLEKRGDGWGLLEGGIASWTPPLSPRRRSPLGEGGGRAVGVSLPRALQFRGNEQFWAIAHQSYGTASWPLGWEATKHIHDCRG